MRIHPWWATLGVLFISMLVMSAAVIHYQLTAAWRLRWVDEQLEINTRFKTDDVYRWLVPDRKSLPLSRWAESPVNTPSAGGTPDLTNLYTCCVLPQTTVQDFRKECPAHRAWYTHVDIRHQRTAIVADLKKYLKSGKLTDDQGKPLKSAAACISQLEQEYQILQGMWEIAEPYHRWTTLYCYTEYPQQWVFTLLRLSYYSRYVPRWAQRWLNQTITWWMNLQLPTWIHKAKKQTKEQTWWIFHGHVDRKIEKMARQLQDKVAQHGYVHDYWPYYSCLIQSFDMQVKDILQEIKRLMARNRELLACLHDLA